MTDTDAKEKWIDELMGRMSLEHKVGQMMVFGLCGTVITPDTKTEPEPGQTVIAIVPEMARNGGQNRTDGYAPRASKG